MNRITKLALQPTFRKLKEAGVTAEELQRELKKFGYTGKKKLPVSEFQRIAAGLIDDRYPEECYPALEDVID